MERKKEEREVKRPKTFDQRIGDKKTKKRNETGNEHSSVAVLCMSVLRDVQCSSINTWNVYYQLFFRQKRKHFC